jgi:threonylcarbamoyladenosine tRNA methylthiotransferase MtaB
VDGLDRLRISSIEPNLLKNEIIEFTAQSEKFVPHFHLPLQSGCDDILKLMKRRYMTALYRQRVEAIITAMPDACIGVDVIVGFPGETQERFLETYNFINSLPIGYLHVFTYSERQNTPANEMKDVVPIPERKRRNKMLRILSEKKKHAFYESQLGTTRPVLFEAENKAGYIYGYTDNYVRVKTPWNPELANKTKYYQLEGIGEDGIVILVIPKSANNNATNFSRI